MSLYTLQPDLFCFLKKRILIKNDSLCKAMVRAVSMVRVLLCGLCLAAPASADVIYFNAGAPIPQKMKGWGYNFHDLTSGRTQVAYMGRITRVFPGADGTRIEFEPAKVTMVNVPWGETDPRLRQQPKVEWAGPKNVSLIKVSDLRIDHEVDGPQDLRFAFSNRDVLLRRWLSSNEIEIGEEPFRTYFLAAGGVVAPPSLMGDLTDLQEGWLVTWLKRGPLSSADRAKLYMDAFGPKGLLVPPNFVSDPRGFHPIQWETDIRTLVFSLLRAAAQDHRYSRPGPGGEAPTNPQGAFGMGINKDRKPRFFLQSVNVIMGMCDQVDSTHPNAQDMGFRARDAVLSAIDAAAIGRHDLIDDPKFWAANAANNRPKLTTGMAVDPSDMVMVALNVIVRSESWQIARLDTSPGRQLAERWDSMPENARPARPRPGERLIHSLLSLAMDPIHAHEPRANDYMRDPRRIVRNVPGYGETTELKSLLVTTIEHLMNGPERRVFLRHTADVLVGSAGSGLLRRGSRGRLLQDWHTTSVSEFALMVIGRMGYAESSVMEELVGSLFSFAVIYGGERGSPRQTWASFVRRGAIASLSNLGSLGERSKRNLKSPGDGVDDELAANALAVGKYEAISNMVFDQVTKVLARYRQGFGSRSDEQFFITLGMMANQPSPPRPLEDHAAAFYDAYERHMRQDPSLSELVGVWEELMSKSRH